MYIGDVWSKGGLKARGQLCFRGTIDVRQFEVEIECQSHFTGKHAFIWAFNVKVNYGESLEVYQVDFYDGTYTRTIMHSSNFISTQFSG